MRSRVFFGATLAIATVLVAAAPPPATVPPSGGAKPPSGWKLAGDVTAGKALFTKHCALCHGETGNGRGLIKYDPPPRDLTDGKLMNPKADWEVYRVVRDGGKPWGLSPAMLAWQSQFNEKQLQDVTAYVRSLARPAK